MTRRKGPASPCPENECDRPARTRGLCDRHYRRWLRERNKASAATSELAVSDDDLARLKISPEVAWYLQSRSIPLPECPPKWKTPEPRDVPGARFDPARVDKVLLVFSLLRHTQGQWAGRPLTPDPWQVAYILAPVFGWVRFDEDAGAWVRIINNLYVDVPRKNGKALALDTPVPTPRGWTTQGELQVGDEVFAADGSVTEVVATTNVMRDRPCFRVGFAGGESVVADAGHLWRTSARKQGRLSEASGLRTTQELAEAATYGTRRDRNHSVQLPEPLQLPDLDLPLDPYLLGYWLGDGHSAAARLTVHGEDLPNVVRQVADAGYYLGKPTWIGPTAAVGISTRDCMQTRLRKLGVLGDKHVPAMYLRASAAQRLALLQGLMDSDGSVSARGVGMSVRQCEFTTTSERLAAAVVELVVSLGLKPSLIASRAMLRGRDVGAKYRVRFTAYRSTPVFRLPRKLDRLGEPAATGVHRARSRSRVIESVESVESVPVKCVQVANADGLYLVGRSMVPTHNSTLSGGIAIYLACADGEQGAQVVTAATTEKQAGFVFGPIKTLAEKSPKLAPYVKAHQKRIVHLPSASYIEVVSSAADAQHGANIHGGVVDELHVHKGPDLVETIESGTGSRIQSLIVIITTADAGKPDTIYARKRLRIEALAAETLRDETTYGVIWACDKEDDPHAELTQRKSNPGFGISPTKAYLRRKSNEAKQSPADLASYLRLHLGLRTRQVTKFLRLEDWDRNASMVVESRLAGRVAYGGLDLGSTSDLTSLAWVFPDGDGGYDVLWRFWAPEASLTSLDQRTAKNASVWVKQGCIVLTPGNVTDYDFVEATIAKDLEVFEVQEIGFDAWNATSLTNNLLAAGAPMVKVSQGFAAMSPPLKEIQRLLVEGTEETPMLRTGGNPVARWMCDNLGVVMDPSKNVRPDKANSADKIDGISALTTAMARAMHHQPEQTSVYDEENGLVVV